MMTRQTSRVTLPAGVFSKAILLIAALAMLSSGCTTSPKTQDQGQAVTTTPMQNLDDPRWWFMRFRLARDSEGEVNSYLDALIADQILSEVIARHSAEIALWRFHRRWPDDSTGHQFSFIFYAPRALADALSGEIERDPLLQQLSADGHLVQFRTHEADPERSADLAATSDASWPPEVQREWPKFIMGASRMWLGLVHSEAGKYADLELYERYQAVETGLDDLWFEHGNHAFFHHLSALFGYRPLRVIRRDIMTF